MNVMRCLLGFAFILSQFSGANAASVDGLSIHSTVRGSGRTIIFVHGWTCDENVWSEQVPEFREGYRSVTIDLPGHGASESPVRVEDYSMKLFANAVEAVRAELGVEKIVLVGHSMGAEVIRAYALEYPQHVAGLVAVDGRLDQRGWMKVERSDVPVTRQVRASFVEGMFVESTPMGLRDQIRKMMMHASAMTAQGSYNAMSSLANQSDKRITAPALTVWAEKTLPDPKLDPRDIYLNWEETRISGTGHFIMMERPDQFNEILKSFLSGRADFGN